MILNSPALDEARSPRWSYGEAGQGRQFSISNSRKGFTLIELIVSIFIFSLITVAILAIFVSTSGASQKAKAIKSLKENTEFALNSIAKDVRMGKIEPNSSYSNGTGPKNILLVKRNIGGAAVCYKIDSTSGSSNLGICDDKVQVSDTDCSKCASSDYKKIIDLSNSGMDFDPANSGFYSCPSNTPSSTNSYPCPGTSGYQRGWVEINLDVDIVPGSEMQADQINIETIVSSRDYGWSEVP